MAAKTTLALGTTGSARFYAFIFIGTLYMQQVPDHGSGRVPAPALRPKHPKPLEADGVSEPLLTLPADYLCAVGQPICVLGRTQIVLFCTQGMDCRLLLRE
jgi:hypothetical protein